MKRFLVVVAVTLCIVACSQTGGVEPDEARTQDLGKPGREQAIAKMVRVNAPPGRPFVDKGQSFPGRAKSHYWIGQDGDRSDVVNCEWSVAVCYQVDADGGGMDVFPVMGNATSGTVTERQLPLAK